MSKEFLSLSKQATDLLEELKKHPSILTVPAGIAGGIGVSNLLTDKEDRSPLRTILSGAAGAGVGAVAGKALSPEMDIKDMPKKQWADRTRNEITPVIGAAGGALKDILWSAWGPVGKSVIMTAAGLLLFNKFAPAGTSANLLRKIPKLDKIIPAPTP